MKYATIFSRCIAFCIDFWVISTIGWAISTGIIILRFGSHLTVREADIVFGDLWIVNILLFLSFLGYFFLADGVYLSRSLGKMILKLRVISADGVKLRMSMYLSRAMYKGIPCGWLIYAGQATMSRNYEIWRTHQNAETTITPTDLARTFLWILIVGVCLTAARDKKKQMVHDKLANTVVIAVDEVSLFPVLLDKCIERIRALRDVGTPTEMLSGRINPCHDVESANKD